VLACAGCSRELDVPVHNSHGGANENATTIATLAAPAADYCRDAGRELDRRVVVAIDLQLPAAELRRGHGRWTSRATVLGIVEALSTFTKRVGGAGRPAHLTFLTGGENRGHLARAPLSDQFGGVRPPSATEFCRIQKWDGGAPTQLLVSVAPNLG